MPARLSLTKAQRDALLLLPDTEEAFVRHYSLVAEDIEIISGYRTPETRLAFALQSGEQALLRLRADPGHRGEPSFACRRSKFLGRGNAERLADLDHPFGCDAEQAAEFLRRSLGQLRGSVDAARAKHGINAVQW